MNTWKQLPQAGFGLLLPMLWWQASVAAATADPYGDFAYEVDSLGSNTVRVIGDEALGGQGSMTNLTIPHSITNRGAPAPSWKRFPTN